ncbi:MAG: AI-2E family transporter [Myxococcota bacterium]
MSESEVQRPALIVYFVLLLAVLALFMKMVAPYALTLVMGVILAVLMQPLYAHLLKRSWTPTQSAVTVTSSLLVLVLGPITLFGIAAARQSISIVDALSKRSLSSYEELLDRLFSLEIFGLVLGTPEEVKAQLSSLARTVVGAVSGATLTLAGQVPDFMIQLILALFASYFLLIDGKSLLAWLGARVPIAAPVRRELFRSFRETSVSVLVASVAAAGVQSVMMMLSFAALGVPGAFLAAGATFIFAWIPLLGSVPVWLVGSLYLYLSGSLAKAAIMVIAGLITGVSDNIVRPLVLQGSSDNMHPLLSIVAIFGGLAMFGIVGVFVGPILAAMLIAVLEAWPLVAREAGILTEATQAETKQAPTLAQPVPNQGRLAEVTLSTPVPVQAIPSSPVPLAVRQSKSNKHSKKSGKRSP